MARRFFQPRIWIQRFAVGQNAELNRQLSELQHGIVEALQNITTTVANYIGLDGINVVPGVEQSVVRTSRDTTTFSSAPAADLVGVAETDIVLFNSSINIDVPGMTAPGVDDTHRKFLWNIGAGVVTLQHNVGVTATENAWYCPLSEDFRLRQYEGVFVDSAGAYWRLSAKAEYWTLEDVYQFNGTTSITSFTASPGWGVEQPGLFRLNPAGGYVHIAHSPSVGQSGFLRLPQLMASGGVMRWTRLTDPTEVIYIKGGPLNSEDVDTPGYSFHWNVYNYSFFTEATSPRWAWDMSKMNATWQRETDIAQVIAQYGSPRSFRTCETRDLAIGVFGTYIVIFRLKQHRSTVYYVSSVAQRQWSFQEAYNVTSTDNDPRDAILDQYGGNVFFLGGQNVTLYRIPLTTANTFQGGVGTITSFSLSTQISYPVGFGYYLDPSTVSPDKLYVWVCGWDATDDFVKVYQYTTETIIDITTLSYTSKSRNVESLTGEGTGRGCYIDENRIVFFGGDLHQFHHLPFTTAKDVSTAQLSSSSSSQSSVDTVIRGCHVTYDGSRVFALGQTGEVMIQWDLISMTTGALYKLDVIPTWDRGYGGRTWMNLSDGSGTSWRYHLAAPGIKYGKSASGGVVDPNQFQEVGVSPLIDAFRVFVTDDDEVEVYAESTTSAICGTRDFYVDLFQEGANLQRVTRMSPVTQPILLGIDSAAESGGSIDFDISSWGLEAGDVVVFWSFGGTSVSFSGTGWNVLYVAGGEFLYAKRWGLSGQTDDDTPSITADSASYGGVIMGFRFAGGRRDGPGIVGGGRVYRVTATNTTGGSSVGFGYNGSYWVSIVLSLGTTTHDSISAGTELETNLFGTDGRVTVVKMDSGNDQAASSSITFGASATYYSYAFGIIPEW